MHSASLSEQRPDEQPAKSLRKAFEILDTDGSGTVSGSKLKAVLSRPSSDGKPSFLAADDIDELLKMFGGADGTVSVDELVEVLSAPVSRAPKPMSAAKAMRSSVTRGGLSGATSATSMEPAKLETSYWKRHGGAEFDEALRHVQLIKVSALVQLGEQQAYDRTAGRPITPMPRCQDWNPNGVADPDALRQWSKDNKDGVKHQVIGLPILVLSICWLDPSHPDRLGEQLQYLLPLFRMYAKEGEFGVLWDYCSLPQKRSQADDDRTEEQKKKFANGLATINRWYVHRLTTVILVTSLPTDLGSYSNPTPYKNRGWTTTERALSSIVKSTACLLDAAYLAQIGMLESLSMSELLDKLIAKRSAPIRPDEFREKLIGNVEAGNIKFTAKGDLEIVSKQYKIGFEDKFKSTEGLYYANLKWNDDELEKLCEALHTCPAERVKRLRLHGNLLTDKSARSLAGAIAKDNLMPQLKLLNVENNKMTREGVYVLDLVCAAKQVDLRVDGQDPEDQDRKDKSPTIRRLSNISMLAGMDVGDSDSQMLSEVVVGPGPLEGKYDAVYLSTDLEPDDVVALKALAPRLRRVPLFCVVGQHTLDKCGMMRDVLKHCGILNFEVVRGRPSNKTFPKGIEKAFQGSSSQQPTARSERNSQTDFNASDCTEQLETFLRKHHSPLAILLKPMHELVGLDQTLLNKTVAVAYGSFNFTTMQRTMIEDVEQGGGSLDKQSAFKKMMDLFFHFKRSVIVERSFSVGRTESLNRNQKIWNYIGKDVKLMKLVQGWQVVSLDDITLDGLPRLVKDLGEKVRVLKNPAVGTSPLHSIGEDDEANIVDMQGQESLDPHALTYAESVELAKSAEKKLAVLRDICEHESSQLPLADPLVAAALLDDHGDLRPFWKRCATTMDVAGKVIVKRNDDATVNWLWSEKEKREELVELVHALLEAALTR